MIPGPPENKAILAPPSDKSAARRYRVGDRVVRDPDRWVASDFDAWGAGKGVGVVVAVGDDLVDVRWPGGRCSHGTDELLPAPTEARPANP